MFNIDFQDSGCGGHLGFPIRKIWAVFDRLPWYFRPSFESTGICFMRRSSKYIFKMAAVAAILAFRSEWFQLFFDQHVTLILPTNFRVIWPFGSGEAQKRFSRWPPWRIPWISDRNDFRYFDLQITLILPSKFRVSWPFGSGGEVQNWFSRWPLWRSSWISDRNDFSYLICKSRRYFLLRLESVGLSAQ